VNTSVWVRKELKLENLLISTMQTDRPLLRRDVFGEELLPIGRQIPTEQGKKADILAVDQLGNSVIIELKRDEAQLGVETQALQYLAEFSAHKGERFIKRFAPDYRSFIRAVDDDVSLDDLSLKDDIQSFIDSNDLEDVNQNSRIILIARRFDPVLFSMGKWFASNGVSFRCIEYAPFQVGTEHFIGFSVVFDDSPAEIFPLAFSSHIISRPPGYFWHNIGAAETKSKQEWWEYLLENSQIAASFTNQRGDEGERLLQDYIKGDRVLAYSSGYGAIGYGIIKKPNSYTLVPANSDKDFLNGRMRHRLAIRWKTVTRDLNNAISAKRIRELGGHHPIPMKVNIKQEEVAKKLIEEMKTRFGSRQRKQL
jgi:hypothetical protein